MNRTYSRLLYGLVLLGSFLIFVPSSRADLVYTYKYTDVPSGFMGSFSWTIVRSGNVPEPFVVTTFDQVEYPKFGSIFEVDFTELDPAYVQVLTLVDPYAPEYPGPAFQKLTWYTNDIFRPFDFLLLNGSRIEFAVALAPEPVPEPSSASLLLPAMLSLAAFRRTNRIQR